MAPKTMTIFAANWINNRIARTRAETLIVAVKKFKQSTGHYPANLQDLVPNFIDHIPLAKYTIAFNDFKFSSNEAHVSLWYVEMPPFGRPSQWSLRPCAPCSTPEKTAASRNVLAMPARTAE